MRTPARHRMHWALTLTAASIALAPLAPAATPATAVNVVPPGSAGTAVSIASAMPAPSSAPAAPSAGTAGTATPIASTTPAIKLATAGSTTNAYSPEVTDRFQRAAELFERARAGSSGAVGPAQDAFKDLLQTDSANPLFVAYYGSTFAMRARDGGAPWQKIKWVNEGINNIDHALALLGPQYDAKTMRGVPISLETRLVAIATYIPLPSLFNRMSVARQQLALAMSDPSFASISSELRGRFYYEDALIAHSDGDAEHERRALREVVKNAPPSLNMDEVRQQLAKLGG